MTTRGQRIHDALDAYVEQRLGDDSSDGTIELPLLDVVTLSIQALLPWVCAVTLLDGVLEVKHRYPAGVNIRPQVREVVRDLLSGMQGSVELRITRVEA